MHTTYTPGESELDDRHEGEENPNAKEEVEGPPEHTRLGRVGSVILRAGTSGSARMRAHEYVRDGANLARLEVPLARAVLVHLCRTEAQQQQRAKC